MIESIPGASTLKWFCSMTAAQMAPTSESPPRTEMRWALPFRPSSTSPINRSSRSRIRVVVSFIRPEALVGIIHDGCPLGIREIWLRGELK